MAAVVRVLCACCAHAVRMLCACCAQAVRKLCASLDHAEQKKSYLSFLLWALKFELRSREVRRVKMYNTAIDDDALVHLVDWIRRA